MSSAGPLASWLNTTFEALQPTARPVASARVGSDSVRMWTTRPGWSGRLATAWAVAGDTTNPAVDVIVAAISDLPPDTAPAPVQRSDLGPGGEVRGLRWAPVRLVWDEAGGLVVGWDPDARRALCLTAAAPPDEAATTPLRPLLHWLVHRSGGVLLPGTALAVGSRGVVVLARPEDLSRATGQAGQDVGTAPGPDSLVAVYPDEHGWWAAPVSGAAAGDQDEAAGEDGHPRSSACRMRVDGLALLTPGRQLADGSAAAAARDAVAPWAALSLPFHQSETLRRIGRLCSELPVRAVSGTAARAEELARWQADCLPLVSVVIPVHNGARFLRRSISSILLQQGARFQIVAVDDGSTDTSLSVLVALLPEVLAAGHELTITSHTENLGVAAARNTGVAAATGSYVAFLDQDDEWLPGRTDVLLTALRRGTAPAVAGRMEIVSDLPEVPDWARPEWFGESHPGNVTGAMLLHRSALGAVGGFDEQMRHGFDDVDWISRLRDSGSMAHVPQVVLRRWVHTGNLSQFSAAGSSELLRAVHDHLGRVRRR